MRVVILFLFFVSLSSALFSQDGFTITVKVIGMESNDGKVFFALFDRQEDFLKDDKIIKAAKVKPENGVATARLTNITKGEYAVSVFYDKNNNGKMDTNFLGIPKEPYGFSNNSKGFMGPPKFENSKFLVSGDTEISITINE